MIILAFMFSENLLDNKKGIQSAAPINDPLVNVNNHPVNDIINARYISFLFIFK
jgi:hypothetical protein